jgi:hypothetical protein
LEKRTKKLFPGASRAWCGDRVRLLAPRPRIAQRREKFLVLFFKKEPLSFLPCLGLTSLLQPATLGSKGEGIHGTSSNTGASGVMAEG